MAYKLLSQIKKRNKRGWGEDKREGAENSIAVLCADVTMPLGVQNETKGTSFKWYFNQNKNVDSF